MTTRTLLLVSGFLLPLAAQPQVGGGSCTNATLNGTFYYLVNGSVASTYQYYPYVELGTMTADGQGNLTGSSRSSFGGSINSHSLTGLYSVQSNCSGSIALAVDSQAVTTVSMQVIDGGQGALLAFAYTDAVLAGTMTRQTADAAPAQCNGASLSGTYGYLLTGSVVLQDGGLYDYLDSGSFTADGNGNLTVINSFLNVQGSTAQSTNSGTYLIASDCSGTAKMVNQLGTFGYQIAIVEDGKRVLFFGTDGGTVLGGTAQPQFSAPGQAVVNAASFEPKVAPGSLFSIFGAGLSQQEASAATKPLPRTLANTQVLIDGQAIPLLYAANGQINAQMPVDAPVGRPVALSVVNGGATSNLVNVKLKAAGPGIFTYPQNHAVVQNQNGTLNADNNPARPGEVLVAYLTGGGAVTAAGPWLTGEAAPSGISPVTAPYTISVGQQTAEAFYLGLTPFFVGLYQANFRVPAVAPGRYPLTVTVNGVASNGPTVAVGQ